MLATCSSVRNDQQQPFENGQYSNHCCLSVRAEARQELPVDGAMANEKLCFLLLPELTEQIGLFARDVYPPLQQITSGATYQ
ncbi:hypothetical protein FQZ97_596330 [compost metagenome]